MSEPVRPPLVIRHADEDGVAEVVLDRPHARNALNTELAGRLRDALAELDDDPAARAIVLSGAPPGFCAGSDLKELAEMTVPQMARHEGAMGAVARTILQLHTPVVAAVERFAIGGGFLLATSCDVVVSSTDARWHLPEAGLGWVPPWGLHALVARVGPIQARRLAWGVHELDGRQIYLLGVVDELAEVGQARPRAWAEAARLAALPAPAVASTKLAFLDVIAAGAATFDAHTQALFASDCASPQAVASFATFDRKNR